MALFDELLARGLKHPLAQTLALAIGSAVSGTAGDEDDLALWDADGALKEGPALSLLATYAVLASTSNGEGAALVGIEDAGTLLAATTVEGALQEIATGLAAVVADYLTASDLAPYTTTADLASTANAKGASLIGIEDAGGLITAATVEGALAENRTAIDAIEADYLVAADIANMLESSDIGVSVQAYDADLTTWAGLTPSANAQSLVTAANYAAMRALLDLEAGTDFVALSGGTFSGDISVPDEAYGVGWNGSLEVPTKNAVYDKIETLSAGGGSWDVIADNESIGTSTTKTFTGLSGYSTIEIIWTNIGTDTNGRTPLLRVGVSGPTIRSTNYDGSWYMINETPTLSEGPKTTDIQLTDTTINNSTIEWCGGRLLFTNFGDALNTEFFGEGGWIDGGVVKRMMWYGQYTTAEALDALQFLWSGSGNFNLGTVTIRGRA